MLPQNITQIFKRLAKKAGVEGRVNPHALRHLVGKSWTDSINPELVRLKLGHTTIVTTAMYYAN